MRFPDEAPDAAPPRTKDGAPLEAGVKRWHADYDGLRVAEVRVERVVTGERGKRYAVTEDDRLLQPGDLYADRGLALSACAAHARLRLQWYEDDCRRYREALAVLEAEAKAEGEAPAA